MNKREELNTMLAAVDELALAMKKKLRAKAREGRAGGLDPMNLGLVKRLLREHVSRLCDDESRQAPDVCNLAMMLWVIGGKP